MTSTSPVAELPHRPVASAWHTVIVLLALFALSLAGALSKTLPFVEAFQKRYGNIPSYCGYTAYDAVYYIADAIKRAGVKDREAITAAARSLKDFDGVLGKWSFDENGDTSLKVMVVETIKDGKFTPVEVVGQ